ncbi:unnamed protein product [Urochloa humidicola]
MEAGVVVREGSAAAGSSSHAGMGHVERWRGWRRRQGIGHASSLRGEASGSAAFLRQRASRPAARGAATGGGCHLPTPEREIELRPPSLIPELLYLSKSSKHATSLIPSLSVGKQAATRVFPHRPWTKSTCSPSFFPPTNTKIVAIHSADPTTRQATTNPFLSADPITRQATTNPSPIRGNPTPIPNPSIWGTARGLHRLCTRAKREEASTDSGGRALGVCCGSGGREAEPRLCMRGELWPAERGVLQRPSRQARCVSSGQQVGKLRLQLLW